MNSIANLRRPAFLSGSIVISEKPQTKPLNKAIFRRFQNNDFIRPSFKQTAPRARHGISEDRLRMIDISEHGTKVQLSDKALEKLSVMVKDETDKAWLKEEARRLDLGETIADLINSPPLGRAQRQREERVDIGSDKLPLAEGLGLIESAMINKDYTENPDKLIQIIYKVVNNEYKNKKNISKKNFNRIKEITKKLRFGANLVDKQVDLKRFLQRPANVLMYLLTTNNNVDNVLIDVDDNSPIPMTKIRSLLKNNRIIDLEDGSVLSSRRADDDKTGETKTNATPLKTSENPETDVTI